MMWLEYYEFDDLKAGKTVEIKLLNYDINMNDIIHVQSCYKDNDELDAKVVQIIKHICDERDTIVLQKIT